MRSFLFYVAWVIVTLIMGLLGLPLLVCSRAVWWLSDRWCGASFWLLRIICRIDMNLQPIPNSAGKLFVANHESTLDTLMLWHSLHRPAFVLKRELYLIPVFGWYLWRTRPIAIKRGTSASIAPMIAQAKARLDENRSVIMFPEGTRSAPERIIPYKRGITMLSQALAQPVNLLALATHHVWPKGSLRKSAGTATLTYIGEMSACTQEIKPWLAQMEQKIRHAAAALH